MCSLNLWRFICWVVSWMESNSSSVSCIHMLCMCSLLSTSFKFSLCGCMFYTFSMFVASTCAFFRKILLFISKAVVSFSDARQQLSRDRSKTTQCLPSPFHPGTVAAGWWPLPHFGLHCKLWASGAFVQTRWTSWWCLQWCLPLFKIYRLLGRVICIRWQASPHSIFSGGF